MQRGLPWRYGDAVTEAALRMEDQLYVRQLQQVLTQHIPRIEAMLADIEATLHPYQVNLDGITPMQFRRPIEYLGQSEW